MARDADRLHRAAIAEFQGGHGDRALELIERAIREDPDAAIQHQTRGQILRAVGRRAEARAAFERAVELAPDFPEARASLGHALLEGGEAGAASGHLARAVALRSGVPEWHFNLALARAQLGDGQQAAASADRALALRPRFAAALNLRGRLFLEAGDTARALDALAAALEADGGLVEAQVNLGVALLARGRYEDAEARLRAALSLRPSSAEAWNNLGNALRRQGRSAEALQAFEKAVECDASLADAWVNHGNMLRELDRVDEALQSIRRGITLRPESGAGHLGAALALLVDGQLEAGWDEYRWRHGTPCDESLRRDLARWAKEGRLVELRAEQGLGDVLFFLRWAPRLRAAGARVRLRADARLFPVLRPTGCIDEFAGESGEPREDAHGILLADLPWLERDGDAPPALALSVAADCLERARRELLATGPAPYIGVAWRSGVSSVDLAEHFVKTIAIAELGAALRGVAGTIVSVQRNPLPGELEELAAAIGRPVTDRSALNSDLTALLPLLAALDDYVGVSSTNVHLLAGLGNEARVLIPTPPEWRYGRAGPSTPWYPQFRLYREHRQQGWSSALAQLSRDLRARHGARS